MTIEYSRYKICREVLGDEEYLYYVALEEEEGESGMLIFSGSLADCNAFVELHRKGLIKWKDEGVFEKIS